MYTAKKFSATIFLNIRMYRHLTLMIGRRDQLKGGGTYEARSYDTERTPSDRIGAVVPKKA